MPGSTADGAQPSPHPPRGGASAELGPEQTRQLLEAIVDGITDAIFAKDREGRYLLLNKAALAVMGKTAAEALGRDDRDVFPLEEAAAVIAHDRQILASREPETAVETMTDAGGTQRIFLATKGPIFDQAGEVSGLFGISRDITEETRLTELARQQAELMEEAQRLSAIGNWHWDAVRDVISWSAEYHRIVGHDPGAPIPGYDEHLSWYTPESAGRLSAAVGEAMANGTPYELDLELVRRDGRQIALIARGEALRDEGGAVVALQGTIQDVTARRAVARELEENEARLQAIYDLAPIGISLVETATGRFADANPRFQEIVGRPLAELHGLTTDMITHPDDRERDITNRQMLIEGIIRNYRREKRYLKPDGRVVWTAVTVVPMWRAGEPPTVHLAMTEDIMDRRRSEDALRASERRFEEFMNRVPAACFIRDSEGRLVYMNASFAETFGAHDWLGKTNAELGPAEVAAALDEADREVLEKGEQLELEQHVPARGEPRTWLTVKFPMESEGQPQVGNIALDITERQRAEEHRFALERRLAEAQKLESLGVLAGGIAHDFNNLLQTIMGNAALAAMESESEEARASLREVEAAAQRAAELSRQMLAYSGQAPFVVQRFDLNELISQMGDALRGVLPPGILLERQVGPGMPVVEADMAQVRQVLMSLVMNAAEAIGDAAGTIRITTSTGETSREALAATYLVSDGFRGGACALLEVADDGCGMDDATRDRVFEPFFTTKMAGRGLGMAGVLGIVRRHAGAIDVESERGSGTTVRVVLPLSADGV